MYAELVPAAMRLRASAVSLMIISFLFCGSLEGFFSLSEQFHTQAEPAYCGLGSLVMGLNALGIDLFAKRRRLVAATPPFLARSNGKLGPRAMRETNATRRGPQFADLFRRKRTACQHEQVDVRFGGIVTSRLRSIKHKRIDGPTGGQHSRQLFDGLAIAVSEIWRRRSTNHRITSSR
jgi:hypothetical protein